MQALLQGHLSRQLQPGGLPRPHRQPVLHLQQLHLLMPTLRGGLPSLRLARSVPDELQKTHLMTMPGHWATLNSFALVCMRTRSKVMHTHVVLLSMPCSGIACYGTARCGTAQHSTAQHSTAQHSTAKHVHPNVQLSSSVSCCTGRHSCPPADGLNLPA